MSGPFQVKNGGVRLFLSYASEDRPRAEEIALALKADGHEVFFDATELRGGESYHQVLRERMAESDRLLFLISPWSVELGSYTLTELRLASDRWPSPSGRVVPVLLRPTPMEAIPAYLRAVTILEPKGNAAAEVAAHVHRLAERPRAWRWFAAVLVAVAVAGGAWWIAGRRVGNGEDRKPFVSTIAESDFVTFFVMDADHLQRDEYALDPASPFPAGGGDVVRLERLAFGRLTDGAKAFSIRVAIANTTGQPIHLDLTPRFFELADDRGRRAELLFFCCETQKDMLSPGQSRSVHLVYRSAPGWEGKETTPGLIHFRITGLLPVVRASWSFRPLATAA